MTKKIKKLMRVYERPGWTITPARGSHLKRRGPNCVRVVTSALNRFAMRRIESDLGWASEGAVSSTLVSELDRQYLERNPMVRVRIRRFVAGENRFDLLDRSEWTAVLKVPRMYHETVGVRMRLSAKSEADARAEARKWLWFFDTCAAEGKTLNMARDEHGRFVGLIPDYIETPEPPRSIVRKG